MTPAVQWCIIGDMRLTDFTELKVLRNGFIAVFEGTAPATLVRPDADNVFECGDFYHGAPANCGPDWYADSPSDLIQTCTALRVGFDNGSACVAGHRHFTDAEYYTEDEARHALAAGHALAPNARII